MKEDLFKENIRLKREIDELKQQIDILVIERDLPSKILQDAVNEFNTSVLEAFTGIFKKFKRR
ncbi:MAG: hypothetical protein GY804_00360 [Alphaproteobacteria bacterium]|nr:hypothetical protein [Alphaproteobacteria bacterium]